MRIQCRVNLVPKLRQVSLSLIECGERVKGTANRSVCLEEKLRKGTGRRRRRQWREDEARRGGKTTITGETGAAVRLVIMANGGSREELIKGWEGQGRGRGKLTPPRPNRFLPFLSQEEILQTERVVSPRGTRPA
ncbi:hypothetical protein J6590_057271 [Homalodisca vitripennis]|nr:hypothetical protein J6590_057271 [Homalodisca vitripennis]